MHLPFAIPHVQRFPGLKPYLRLFIADLLLYLIAEAVLVETIHVGGKRVLAVALSFSLKKISDKKI